MISNLASPITAVTVPWARPVGTALIPAFSSNAITLSGSSTVAMSMSLTARPSTAARTQPPTKRASPPSDVTALMTARVLSASIQSGGTIRPAGASGALFSSSPGIRLTP